MTTETLTEIKESKYSIIGTRPVRPDGTDKVTGRAQYAADITLPGMLFGEIVRSPHAHAKIIEIDVSEVMDIEGVKAVVTGKDFPDLKDLIKSTGEGAVNIRHRSDNIMAKDKALYQGHAIAAVAAISKKIAKQAVKKIKITYEILSHVITAPEAMKEDAPILHDDLRTRESGKKGDQRTNIAVHHQNKRGDIEEGFRNADVVVEREFNTAMVHQGYIEPQSSTALYNNDGNILVWTSTQGAFGIRSDVSDVLQIPVSRINVTPLEIGGGFGGKVPSYLDPVGVLLSKKSGHLPVKLTMSRKDVLTATGPTSGSYIKVKIGAKNTGEITAAQAYLAYEAGAYPGSPFGAAMGVIFAPYKLDNVLVDGYDVVVNKPKVEAYRAPGGSNAAFASETVIDEICEKIKMDPLEFRLINAVKEGDRRADGPILDKIGLIEVLEEAKQHPHYKSELKKEYVGRGIAAGFWFNYSGKSSAHASVNADGTINLIEGSTDIGGSRASIAMQLAETVQLPYENINPSVVDTKSVGYTEGTYGSRTTYSTGWAAYNIGKDIIEQMTEKASKYLEVDVAEVEYSEGVFRSNDKEVDFTTLSKKMGGGAVTASASVRPSKAGPGFAVHIVDVAVDPETYKVSILRYTAFQDVGTAIHPDYVEGQIQGGAVQGIGWALNEEYFYDDKGRLVNDTLLDYRMPVALDVPMIDCVLIEVPDPDHPYGVRGVGEVPIVPPVAAIANAIHNAIGIRPKKLPMSPRNLFEQVHEID